MLAPANCQRRWRAKPAERQTRRGRELNHRLRTGDSIPQRATGRLRSEVVEQDTDTHPAGHEQENDGHRAQGAHGPGKGKPGESPGETRVGRVRKDKERQVVQRMAADCRDYPGGARGMSGIAADDQGFERLESQPVEAFDTIRMMNELIGCLNVTTCTRGLYSSPISSLLRNQSASIILPGIDAFLPMTSTISVHTTSLTPSIAFRTS